MAGIVQVGRTLLSPFISLGSWYNKTAQGAPFLTGIVTTGVKTSAADIFAQKASEARARARVRVCVVDG
jgi:hypothetical protein